MHHEAISNKNSEITWLHWVLKPSLSSPTLPDSCVVYKYSEDAGESLLPWTKSENIVCLHL